MRRLIVTAVGLLFVVVQAPALAQHMNASDGPCRQSVVTTDLAACLEKARAKADTDLNRVYGAIRQVLVGEDRQRLTGAERSWLIYRDSMCAAERGLYGGGTASGPAYLACLEALTRHHVQDLRAAFQWKIDK